ncbi:MAG: CaiB/BaiF CoA transferase family protein [Lachnospiraceae bacterium]
MQILEGVKVLDISCVVAAPMSAALLAEFGADVIKIEIPEGGDGLRESRVRLKDVALYPKMLNRNKKCITLDFHSQEATKYFYKLVKWADVVIANFRPETLKKFHIDYEDIVTYNPQIIYMDFSAYGRTGPYANKPGYARAAEAYAGLTYITGNPDEQPVFSGTWIADGVGGIYAAYMIMLALYHRERTGEGQLLDLGLYEPIFRIMDDIPITYAGKGEVRERQGNKHQYSAPNNMYRTKDDRWLALPVNSQKMFKRFCNAIEKKELIEDSRFVDIKSRYENREILDQIVADWVCNHTLEEIIEIFDEFNVAYGPVNSIQDLFEDKQIWERGSLVKQYDEELKEELVVNGVCGKFSKTPGKIKWNGRKKGADNEEIYLNLLKISQEEYERLKKENII